MFGVVPKPLWSQRIQADEDNRILLGLNSLVVRHPPTSSLVVIETGLGNKLSPKQRQIHQNQELLPQSLASAGVRPEAVTHVLNTHLHFDHCGWNTTLHPDGSIRPTFPNARYLFAAGELAHGRLQLDRDRVSYLSPNYDPLIASGQLTLLDPHGLGAFTPDDPRLRDPAASTLPPLPIQASAEILPGLTVESFPGHTAHMLVIHIHSGGQHACYAGDLFPTHNHLDPTWVMGYDLDPLRCIEERKRFLARAIPERWLIIFPHDHEVPTTPIQLNEKGRPIAAP
ncbi:MAG TPA: MBL fold metallo-hydrolase [Acidobacteriaceae bacterium]|jgi:glyoxylase-like metal-dependent hydrolase (beta-lactamase superfamily II)|nr:MBL fold metallo-hydrolase [Acidobacteriaceae bacterium]